MTIEDEIFEDMKARYKEGNFSMARILPDIHFMFHYADVLRGDYDEPKKKEIVEEPRAGEAEIITAFKKARG